MNKTEITLDSFKIRIPIEQIQNANKVLTAGWSKIQLTTGEVDEDYKDTAYPHRQHGITTRFKIERQTTGYKDTANRTIRKEYLTILVNSKMLKHDYLTGIALENIEQVYKYLIDLKIVSFSFESFISSEIVDVDFKKDLDLRPSKFKHLIKHLSSTTRLSRKLKSGCELFEKKENLGIQFSKRSTTSIASNPFIKLYHKTIELKYNSREFYNTYLNNVDIEDIARIEFTIKNKKHFKRFNILDHTLENILRIEQKTRLSILNEIFDTHIDRKQKMSIETKASSPEKITLNKNMLVQFMNMSLKSFTFEQILENATSDITNPKLVQRKKRELKELYYTYVSTSKTAKESKVVNDFYIWLDSK